MIPNLPARRLACLSLTVTIVLAAAALVQLWVSVRNHSATGLALVIAAGALLSGALLWAAQLRLSAQGRAAAPGEAGEEPPRDTEELELRVRRRTAELSALTNHLQQLAEKEKASLARLLHDELGGLLIAVKMDASWLCKRWPNPTPEIQARWARVLKVLDDGVDFKRRIVENLRPSLLDNMGLLPAVRWIVEETCSDAGLQYTEIYPEHEPVLSEDASLMLFRLVQESLVNVVKHAQATHVRVQIELDGSQMSLLIEDNGSGLEPERRDALSSHGLAIMRHRVRNSGGTLQLEASGHGGTRVHARLPLERILRSPGEATKSAPAAAGLAPTAQAIRS